jgi:hypothetical protein
MKRVTFILFICLCSCAQAQKMKVGFRGGASLANFYEHNASSDELTVSGSGMATSGAIILDPSIRPANEYYETDLFSDIRMGFFSEFFINWELNKKWEIEAGLGYCQKGINVVYKLTSQSVNANNTITKISYQFNRDLQLNYITLPAVFKYKVSRNERFYVVGGIYNAIAINFDIDNSTSIKNSLTTNSGQAILESYSTSTYTKAYANFFDCGLVGGFGLEWPLKNQWSVGIDLRGTMGVLSVPSKFEEHRFLSFSPTTKNINFEAGLRILRSIK